MSYEIVIGKDTFTVTPLDALETFALQPRLAPAITEVVVGLAAVLFSQAERPADAGPPDLEARELAAEAVRKSTADDLAEAAGKVDLGSLDIAEFMPIVRKFCAALPSSELRALTRTLLSGTTLNGSPLFTGGGANGAGEPFGSLMRGRTVDTWRLLWHALKVNYPDFFAVFAARGGKGPTTPAASSEA